jgi:hypothetical protein
MKGGQMLENKDWIVWCLHNLPFAALATAHSPPNRPLVTRLSEQLIVGVFAGILSAAGALYVDNIHNQDSIQTINNNMQDIKLQLRAITDITVNQAVSHNDIADLKRRIGKIEDRRK